MVSTEFHTLSARSDAIDQAVVCVHVICESRRGSSDCFICPSIAEVEVYQVIVSV